MFWSIETDPNLNTYLTQSSPKRLKRRSACFLHVNRPTRGFKWKCHSILSGIYFTSIVLQIEKKKNIYIYIYIIIIIIIKSATNALSAQTVRKC